MFLLKPVKAQVTNPEESEKTAQSYFHNNDYHNALSLFNRLYYVSPQDAGYQYYIGRCMLALKENSDEAINYLRFAAVKNFSADAWFYLGQAYYFNAQYDKAVSAYRRFTREGKKAEIRRLSAKEMLSKAENKQKDKLKTGFEKPKEESLSSVTAKKEEDLQNNLTLPSTSTENLENKATVEKSTVPEHYAYESADQELSDALQLQLKADSLKRLAKIKRAELKETDDQEERSELVTEISSLEKKSVSSQTKADQYYRKIQQQPVKNKTDDTIQQRSNLIEPKEEINGIKVYRYKPDEMPEKTEAAAIQNNQDIIVKNINEEIRTLNEFSIKPEPAYNEDYPIPSRMPEPGALIYYIQLSVFSKKAANNAFGGITPVCFEKIEAKGLFKYYAGRFGSVLKAEEALLKIKQYGFPDAFLVAFYNDGQIQIDKARQMEFTQIK